MKEITSTKKNYCSDCELPRSSHTHNWIGELVDYIFIPKLMFGFTSKMEKHVDTIMEKLLIFFRQASMREDFTEKDIQLRSSCFINEAKKHGAKFKLLHGPFGFTDHFQMKHNDKLIRFESLPIARFINKKKAHLVDDKQVCKNLLEEGGFPIAKGKSFWFWQKKKALDYGLKEIGFPLVVKPRSGSVSRHVTTNINTESDLIQAINNSIQYSPNFIIEKFVTKAYVHRVTMIDFDFMACAKQIPAHIIGDGISSIENLIAKKNSNPKRDNKFIYQLQIDKTSHDLLDKQSHNLNSIPNENEIIFLQKDPFMKLGGDLAEVTEKMHPDNKKLFFDVAKYIDIRIVGLDFLINDISTSWKEQNCAILELNPVPCIEMHHLPTYGEPKNPAKALLDMTLKYYL